MLLYDRHAALRLFPTQLEINKHSESYFVCFLYFFLSKCRLNHLIQHELSSSCIEETKLLLVDY